MTLTLMDYSECKTKLGVKLLAISRNHGFKKEEKINEANKVIAKFLKDIDCYDIVKVLDDIYK